MDQRVRRITRQKVSHFILGEEGRVGSRSAFVAATVVGVTSLATMLLGVAQNATAAMCFELQCNPPGMQYCCVCIDQSGQYCVNGSHNCSSTDQSLGGIISCWFIGP